jgi:hypothetical protein
VEVMRGRKGSVNIRLRSTWKGISILRLGD